MLPRLTEKKKDAIALFALGSSAEFRTVEHIFGVSKSFVCTTSLVNFREEFWAKMKHIYMNFFPLSREIVEQCVSKLELVGMPQCFAALGKLTNYGIVLNY